jgi:hypothetical protein
MELRAEDQIQRLCERFAVARDVRELHEVSRQLGKVLDARVGDLGLEAAEKRRAALTPLKSGSHPLC